MNYSIILNKFDTAYYVLNENKSISHHIIRIEIKEFLAINNSPFLTIVDYLNNLYKERILYIKEMYTLSLSVNLISLSNKFYGRLENIDEVNSSIDLDSFFQLQLIRLPIKKSKSLYAQEFYRCPILFDLGINIQELSAYYLEYRCKSDILNNWEYQRELIVCNDILYF